MKEYIIGVPERTGIEDPAMVPAINQRELVRCKDCMHYRYYGLSEETVSECTIDHCENPDGNLFCAAGKRKDS